ncbi:MAG: DUF485 domain-containing protein [Labilithrix sp.]|nr:DUF485 domain-containing protein [Labilithrix sp.]MCW5812436.1 DUF485 domain-containing protein [Labilithrix sp.]
MAAEIELRALMMGTYFGFIMLVAYDKASAGALVGPGLSWGILLGALVIVVAWVVLICLSPEPAAEKKFAEVERRMHLGPDA